MYITEYSTETCAGRFRKGAIVRYIQRSNVGTLGICRRKVAIVANGHTISHRAFDPARHSITFR